MTEHLSSLDLHKNEATILQQMQRYRGFPFVEGESFSSLDEVMAQSRDAIFQSVEAVIQGTKTPEEMQRHIICLTGLPGVGKTTLAHGIVKEYVDVVALRCAEMGMPMNVMMAEFDEYAQKYVGPGKEFDIDPLKPFPDYVLEAIGMRMDTDIAERLKKKPNTIVIADRPGGTQATINDTQWLNNKPTEWIARPYGSLGGNIARGDYPFDGIPLHLTMVGVIGGPHTLEGVSERDKMIVEDSSLEATNARRRQRGLRLITEEELQWNKRGAPEETVYLVHKKQWALVRHVLYPSQEEKRKLLEEYVPQFVMDIITQKAIREIPALMEYHIKTHPQIQELWQQLQDVAAQQQGPHHSSSLLLWNLCWDFAGAQVLKHTLGMDLPSSSPRPQLATIIYNEVATIRGL